MTSSVDNLLEVFSDQFNYENMQHSTSSNNKAKNNNRDRATQSHSSSSWTFDKVDNILNIQGDQSEQLEANFLINYMGSKRFFAIDNQTIEQLPRGNIYLII